MSKIDTTTTRYCQAYVPQIQPVEQPAGADALPPPVRRGQPERSGCSASSWRRPVRRAADARSTTSRSPRSSSSSPRASADAARRRWSTSRAATPTSQTVQVAIGQKLLAESGHANADRSRRPSSAARSPPQDWLKDHSISIDPVFGVAVDGGQFKPATDQTSYPLSPLASQGVAARRLPARPRLHRGAAARRRSAADGRLTMTGASRCSTSCADMRRLRRDCPWKREQTHRSLARYLQEETAETLEAIDTGDPDHLREELGDLLLQVYFHAVIAEESGDVHPRRRRPRHRRQDAPAQPSRLRPRLRSRGCRRPRSTQQWQEIKRERRGSTARSRASPYDGIAPRLPALLLATKMLERDPRRRRAAPRRDAGADLGDRLLALVAEAVLGDEPPERPLTGAQAEGAPLGASSVDLGPSDAPHVGHAARGEQALDPSSDANSPGRRRSGRRAARREVGAKSPSTASRWRRLAERGMPIRPSCAAGSSRSAGRPGSGAKKRTSDEAATSRTLGDAQDAGTTTVSTCDSRLLGRAPGDGRASRASVGGRDRPLGTDRPSRGEGGAPRPQPSVDQVPRRADRGSPPDPRRSGRRTDTALVVVLGDLVEDLRRVVPLRQVVHALILRVVDPARCAGSPARRPVDGIRTTPRVLRGSPATPRIV